MKKLKEIWNENRVLFVLFIIVVICVFIILGVCLKYFFGASKSNYGERLEGIENVLITDDAKNNIISNIKNDEAIEDVNINISGKIVYISLKFKNDVSLNDAQAKALASLMAFSEDYLNFYDFQYTLKGSTSDSGDYVLWGAKNASGNGLIWINNTEDVKTVEQ